MLRRIKPKNIICYNTPFLEMTGNIIFVDYDLSSWRHYEGDLSKEKSKSHGIIKMGFILNEKGSAYGGKWEPKKEDDRRFIDKPGTTNVTQSSSHQAKKVVIKELRTFAMMEEVQKKYILLFITLQMLILIHILI